MTREEIRIKLSNVDFDVLEKVISVNNYIAGSYYFKNLNEVIELGKNLLQILEKMDIQEPTLERIDVLTQAEDILISFFNSINPDYAYRFQNIMQEKNEKGEPLVHYIKGSDMSEVSFNGEIKLALTGTIEDLFALMHEMVHLFSSAYKQRSWIMSFFCEIPSITMEFMLYNYILREYPVYSEEAQKFLLSRLAWTIQNVDFLILSKDLIDLCRPQESILSLQDRILDYLESSNYSCSKVDTLIRELERISSNKMMNYPIAMRYVIGFVLACYFQKSIKENPETINDLCRLIQILGNSDFEFEQDILEIRKIIPIVGPPFKGLTELRQYYEKCSATLSRDGLSINYIADLELDFIKIDDATLNSLMEACNEIISESIFSNEKEKIKR